MEFRNLTPFGALYFASLDAADTPYRTIVMRVGYRIGVDGRGETVLTPIDDEPVPLCVQDEYFEALNTSSPRWESDLAPYKPACDVVVIGSAHAPRGVPAPIVRVSLGIRSSAGRSLLDKSLIITGERHFRRVAPPLAALCGLAAKVSRSRWKPNPWRLIEPQPFATLPLRYEYAWGGQSRIDAGEDAARRVPGHARLTPQQLAEHPDAAAPEAQRPVAHVACERNPLGRGAVAAWWLEATRAETVPAPRIESGSAQVTAEDFWRQAQEPTEPPPAACRPAGFGAVGRAWQPRRALAGTYDQYWLDNRHPWSPADFDFAYWNCAPEDQQLPYLAGDEEIVFTNLCRADAPGARRDDRGNSVLRCPLPRHRAFVLTRWRNGLLLPLPMRIDTLIADLEARRIDLVWRLVLPQSLPIRVTEARYEVDPDAPLVRRASGGAEARAHG